MNKILFELEIKYILGEIFNRRFYIRINLWVNLNKEKIIIVTKSNMGRNSYFITSTTFIGAMLANSNSRLSRIAFIETPSSKVIVILLKSIHNYVDIDHKYNIPTAKAEIVMIFFSF